MRARKMTSEEEEVIERLADETAKATDRRLGKPRSEQERANWTSAYHATMDMLTIKAGLRVTLKG